MSDSDFMLEQLDFIPTRQPCECPGCPAHGLGGCLHTAVFCVRVHAMGHCNDPVFADTGGYAVQFLCHPCMTYRAQRISILFGQSHAAKQHLGGYLHCVPCGRDLIKVDDFWESRAI